MNTRYMPHGAVLSGASGSGKTALAEALIVAFGSHTESHTGTGTGTGAGTAAGAGAGSGAGTSAVCANPTAAIRGSIVAASTLFRRDLGETEEVVKQLFAAAARKAPHLLVMDELDALTGTGTGTGASAGTGTGTARARARARARAGAGTA